MKINKGLLAIKGHYFLRYSGSAYLVMMLPVLVRSKGLSSQTVGLLWTVLSFVGLIANSITGTLADYFRVHRIVFVASLTCLLTGIVSVYWIPKLPFGIEASEESVSLVSAGNATLHPGEFVASNSSFLGVGVAVVDSEITVGEGQLAPLGQPPGEEAMVVPGEDASLASLIEYPHFWLISFAVMVEQIGFSTCVSISDAVCFQILGSERHKYGQQRLWGTIGNGLMAVVSGILVDVYSKGLPEKDYLPAIICCIIIMSADIMLVAKMNIPYHANDKLKMREVGTALLHPQVLLFLMTVYVSGASLGIVWVFKLMLVEDVALAWDPEFPALKLLQGLNLGSETFLGELPFFFLSGLIIERLGYKTVLAASLLSTGVRCCLYYTVSNPWFFIPIELLSGPSYSLFHSVMAYYTSRIAPPGAQATLQSVVRATFSCGLSTAGFLGGFLYNTMGGSVAFLQVGVFDGVYVLVFCLLHVLVDKYCIANKVAVEVGCDVLEDAAKVDPFATEAPEVLKELFLEKKYPEAARSIAGDPESTEDERERFFV